MLTLSEECGDILHMKKFAVGVGLAAWLLAGTGARAAASAVCEAENAKLDAARVEVVSHDPFSGKKGVALKAGAASLAEATNAAPDLVFEVRVPRPGRYSLSTWAAVDEAGAARMRAARSKFESLFAKIRVGGQRPTRRVVFVPWSDPKLCWQQLGVFDLEESQPVAFWLPDGVRLDRLEVHPYRPPAVPREVVDYTPSVLPPASHPRLWVNPEALAEIRKRLTHPEHQPHWDRLRKLAARPFAFAPQPDCEVAYNTPLEQAALAKAFVFLVQGDAKAGREAADLMLRYLPQVEFGNLLDVTREVGAAIYAGSCVYDWCYGLYSTEERELLRKNLMRLAEMMECGWPPFRQTIVNGHGNEAQVNRDLLAMSIAVYDEDPLPYRYCAYKVLEELVPMRRFEYQSPRHNQGVSYAAYRFGWEMHAAWLMRRLCGHEVFDANIKSVPYYWLYMRLPDGGMLRDGDGVCNGPYWSHSQTFLLGYAYSGDPVVKGEYQRQAASRGDDLLFLLLNDPAVTAEPRLEGLPLTIDFGPVLGGMIARTGWSLGTNSADVVAEVKGGGYHFGNHQHADAGSIQIYYRGLQVAKLGQYKFYGTPYDMNFNKRSAAQSVLLVFDPQEKVLNGLANDGGSRFLQSHPRTPEEAKANPLFSYGQVVSCSFGPSPKAPAFSYFCADLKGAYSEKVASYTRRFCFLNLGLPGHPAAMIVADDITSANAAFKKVWQLNTLRPPQLTRDGARLWNVEGGVTGRLDVCMLLPGGGDRTVELLSGEDASSVAGKRYAPPKPNEAEANGCRLLLSPRQARERDRFLTVLQACDGEPLPVSYEESGAMDVIRVADRIVALPKASGLSAAPFAVKVPAGGQTYHVLVAGLQDGAWRLVADGAPLREVAVEKGKNSLIFEARGGTCHLEPLEMR